MLALVLGVSVCPLLGAPPPATAPADTPPPAERRTAGTRAAPLPVDEAQEQALLALAGEGFRIYRTAHFLVAYDTPRSMVESLSARLELTYDSVTRFCQNSGFPVRPLNRRLEVIFFDQAADYTRYANRFRFNSRGTYGFYLERTNRAAFFNVHNDPEVRKLHAGIEAARDSVVRMEETVKSLRGNAAYVDVTYSDGRQVRLTRSQAKQEVEALRKKIKRLDARRQAYCDRINQTVVQHEVAHQTLYNTGVHARNAFNPKWVVEGLACMFENPPGAAGGGLSAVNQSRLEDFRRAVAGDSGQTALNTRMYREAVADGRITALEDLVRNPELFNERGEDGAKHYAAAWALLHYLHRTQNKALAAYLREIASRPPGTMPDPDAEQELFEKHFGPLDDAFVVRFSRYILSLPYRPPN
ncbi:MAG TPA: DUF1570 domain-containing protein [Phycisphaerae bacterium]|nr:DUF1570 domain-containing protein [Phycisphaerae bacterium]HOM52811.1 DUF1570 domain-containing protein [Phycisphaerae bacterium]HOQ85681.1 DUF1570 domain-containing protein [Phycisphaerae bacterium]HPP27927.1 DUF1570 domain-containing protein [Phycisphaerae bacterium]HQE29119.1 DUF1570 domain-containing protein [Phycisphaerae bacterium]